MEQRGGADATAEGILVYPVTSEPLDNSYLVQGHKVRVYTLNLAQHWRGIERELKGLVA